MATYDQYERSDSPRLSTGSSSLARGVDWEGEGINILIVGIAIVAIILILPSLFNAPTAEVVPTEADIETEERIRIVGE